MFKYIFNRLKERSTWLGLIGLVTACGATISAELCRADKTKARGGQSMHNFGQAWDIGIFQGKKHFPEHELYKALGQLTNTTPVLSWGGSSNHAHYQLNTYGDIESIRKEFDNQFAKILRQMKVYFKDRI